MPIKTNFSLYNNFIPRKMVSNAHWISQIQRLSGHVSKDENPSLPGIKARSTSPEKTT
jgi:hypothetical protein